MKKHKVKYLTEEELNKRAREVWPDSGLGNIGMMGECITSIERDGTNALICEWYVGALPQCKTCYRHTKRGMKRRPQALAYVCGETDSFND